MFRKLKSLDGGAKARLLDEAKGLFRLKSTPRLRMTMGGEEYTIG